jgi:hypothetical protein
MNGDAWNSHRWSSTNPRQIELEPGRSVLQHHCSRCRRDFVESTSGERWAVYVSVFSFKRLPDQISARWVDEMCPGAPMPFDREIRSRLIDHHAK